MIRADVINLIQQATHGVLDTPQETKRQVFCAVDSVNRTEYYRALQYDLHPEVVFILSDYAEYQGESICEWNGIRYDIIRTYVDGLKVELTCERSKTQPVAPPPPPVYPVVIPEQTFTAEAQEYYYSAVLTGDMIPLVAGNVYRVTVDGVAHDVGGLRYEDSPVVVLIDNITLDDWSFQLGQWYEDDELITMIIVKTAGDHTVKVELVQELEDVVIPLQTFTYTELDDAAVLEALMPLQSADICRVTFDGIEYELTASSIYAGLGELDNFGEPSFRHYPFYAGVYRDGNGYCYCAETGVHTIQVLLIGHGEPEPV